MAMRLNTQHRNAAVTLLLGAGAVAYALLVFLPTQRNIAGLQAELTERQDTIGQGQAQRAALAEVDRQLDAALRFAHRWRENAPSTSHRAPALAEVTRCAVAAGVPPVQFVPRPTEPMATVSRIPIAITCRGTFAEVLDLLARLEALPATIWIEDLRVYSSPHDAQRLQCDLALAVFADNHDSSH